MVGPVRVLHKGITDMPIGAINWNGPEKILCLRGAGPLRGSSQFFSIRLDGNTIFIDDSPTIDTKEGETDPNLKTWDTSPINELQAVKMTGNADTKRQQAVDIVQLKVFDVVTPLADLASDDPDKTIDPGRFPVEFWGNLLGKQAAPFDHYVARSVILVDFDKADFDNGILTASIRRAKVL